MADTSVVTYSGEALLLPQRSIAGYTAQVTIEEQHEDRMVLTDHPIEQGATITDHAYKLPSDVLISIGWAEGSSQNTNRSPTFLNDLYNAFLAIQISRTLFDVTTKRRQYTNMLLESISLTTDAQTENSMILRLTCREILIANTRTLTIGQSSDNQAIPQKTLPAVPQSQQNLLPAPTVQLSTEDYDTYYTPPGGV